MQTFLGTIAEDLYKRYQEQLADVCIVFPNRRASLFFRKYLSELLVEPIWSPEITTINDFFLQHAQWQTADQLTLLFELYTTWINVTGYKESFDNFFYWGETLLRDFNDVDQYMVKAAAIFQMIEYQKNLDEQFNYLDEEQKQVLKQFWKNFDKDELSSQQKEFVKVWEVLNNVYQEFKKSLATKNLAYEGMNYRDIIERLHKNEIVFDNPKIIFVGFNALSKCEESLFDYLQEKKRAEFYWDANDYYLNDKFNEAGHYLRKNRIRYFESSKFPLSASPLSKEENTEVIKFPKQIKIIGVPLEVGQAKVVGEELQNNNYKHEQTAVVLADEHLLFPVLHSIPDKIKQMNVTMGYPFKDTQLHNFIESLIELQQTAKHKKGYIQFYHKSFIAVLKHSYFVSYNAELSKNIIAQIQKQNSIYVSVEQWQEDVFIQKICKPLQQITDVTHYLLEILDDVYSITNKKAEESNTVEQEYIYHFTLSLKRLNEIITQNKIDISLEIFYRLLQKIIQQLRIPFAGEPLEGLQIMGLMETRCLDFENIFILSMNEGIIPSKSVQISFIPYNIRKGFHLPVSDHNDAIFAYYFYRSIQRAKNIYLLYNTEAADDSLSGEMSRFLYQLKYESGFGDVAFSILNRQIKSLPSQKISIPVNDSIKEKLKKYIVGETAETSILSPSAINTYLDCRLRFYFKYVAGLYEKDEITEEIDAADFGNLLHTALEKLYKPYINKVITKDTVDELKKDVEAVILFSFEEHYGSNSATKKVQALEGKNIIIKNVIEEYILAILKKDAVYAPFEMLGIELGSEEKLFYDFNCTINNQAKKIRIGGKIDRVDKKENTVRIIDYKTGKDSKEIKDIASLFSPENKKRNKAAFQTILYGLLYQYKYAALAQIEPGLYNVKEMFLDDFTSRFTIDKTPLLNIDAITDEYQKYLQQFLEEIFNVQKPFDQTQDIKKCENCAYVEICNKS